MPATELWLGSGSVGKHPPFVRVHRAQAGVSAASSSLQGDPFTTRPQKDYPAAQRARRNARTEGFCGISLDGPLSYSQSAL